MGVSMHSVEHDFFIDGEAKEKARRQLRQTLSGPYAYVRDSWRDAVSLEELLDEWRWETVTDPESGDITDISFAGENAGDDDDLFIALGPFVRAGSYIQLDVEGEISRYVFDGERCQRKYATLSFE